MSGFNSSGNDIKKQTEYKNSIRIRCTKCGNYQLVKKGTLCHEQYRCSKHVER